MILKFDRGTKNNTVTGFVNHPFVFASISAGVTLLMSLAMLYNLPFSEKFSVIWPASGIALASLMLTRRKAFVYAILAHALAIFAARGLMSHDWIGSFFSSTLEMINVTSIALILRNISVNRNIFANVRKISMFLTVSALMSVFTGIFSMFLPPFRWENKVSMEWGIWVLSIIPSYWVITPLILAGFRKNEPDEATGSKQDHPRKFDLWQVALAVVADVIIAVTLHSIPFSFTSSIILIMIAIPLMLFAAVRFKNLPFMILLIGVGESAITNAYMFYNGFIPTHPLEMAPLITAKLVYLIFAGSLLIISVLISTLGEQKGLVYRTRNEFAANFTDSHLGMLHAEPDGRIQRGNKSMARLLGYDRPDDINTALEKDPNCLFYGEEDLASFMRLVEYKFGWVDAPLTLRSKTGDPVEVEVAGRPWFEADKRVFIEIIVTDLSKVILLNQHLAAAEERLRLASAAGGVGIWEMDLAADKLYMNSMMERWFGRATDSLSIDLTDLRDLIDPAMYSTFDTKIAAITAGTEDFFEVEVRAKANGLGWRMFNFTGKRMFNEYDKPIDRWIGTVWDTTNEYEQRVRLSQLNENLRIQIEDNRKLRDTIANSAARDLSTGLYTRNHMQSLHSAMAASDAGPGLDHTLIMIEIRDGSILLKTVGLERSQKLVTLLGEITRQHFRATDHIGRMNTFMIGVLTDLRDDDEIRTRMNRITADFDAMVLAEMNSTLVLRLAVAGYPQHGTNWVALVSSAERMLA